MAKDKKPKKGKSSGKRRQGGPSLKSLASNPVVADVVAAALVATASALKDSGRARALASDVGDELTKLSKPGSEQGSELWNMALQIGTRTLAAIAAAPKRRKGSR